MKKRSRLLFVGCICLLGAAAFFMGGSPLTSTQTSHASKETEGSMSLAYKTETPAIPSIDASAPSTYETASFGLG